MRSKENTSTILENKTLNIGAFRRLPISELLPSCLRKRIGDPNKKHTLYLKSKEAHPSQTSCNILFGKGYASSKISLLNAIPAPVNRFRKIFNTNEDDGEILSHIE